MKLTTEQRSTINLLAGQMMAANNNYAIDPIAYDANNNALNAYLKAILGGVVFHLVHDTNQGFNWGANNSYSDDVEAAVANRMDEVNEDAKRHRERIVIDIIGSTGEAMSIAKLIGFTAFTVEQITDALKELGKDYPVTVDRSGKYRIED